MVRGGSSARPPAAPGSPRPLLLIRSGTRSLPLPSMPGSRGRGSIRVEVRAGQIRALCALVVPAQMKAVRGSWIRARHVRVAGARAAAVTGRGCGSLRPVGCRRALLCRFGLRHGGDGEDHAGHDVDRLGVGQAVVEAQGVPGPERDRVADDRAQPTVVIMGTAPRIVSPAPVTTPVTTGTSPGWASRPVMTAPARMVTVGSAWAAWRMMLSTSGRRAHITASPGPSPRSSGMGSAPRAMSVS